MDASASPSKTIEIVVLDFTLVLAIDSSAAETIAGLVDVTKKHGVKICYSRCSTCAAAVAYHLQGGNM